MRQVLSFSRLSTLLISLTTLACSSAESETDTDVTATGTGTSTTVSTTTTATTTATPTTTDGDPSAGSSGTTEPGGDPTGDLSTGVLTTGGPTTGDTSTGDLTTGDTTTGAAEELPPIDSAEQLEAWLAEGAYKAWAAESKVHASTGPHGGGVRTYVNAIALGSLAAQQTEHPQDTALVKELYGDGDTVIGYAVMRKTAPQSEGGANWYWYERVDANVYADGLGVGLCSGCHGGGADYILTPYPLQ